MNDPRPYQWDYDRSAAEEILRRSYDTFSVGVFQWLPKASGKGLKRSTSIRVNGYTAEPRRVFDRADKLCQQLNDAGVRAESPPPWLQKQYSVPKPASMVIKRSSDDLTSAQVRALREQVMKEELLPLGFVKGEAGTDVRRRGEQIHLIDFQPSRYGHEFTVNLAFHYTFVPPLFQKRRLALREFGQLDCVLRARIGHFLPENRDTWFKYGEDRVALRDVLVRCATESLLILDRQAEFWANPRRVLAAINSEIREPWSYHHRDDLVTGTIEMRLGHLDHAHGALEHWISSRELRSDPALYSVLIDKLNEFRQCATTESNVAQLDWVLP